MSDIRIRRAASKDIPRIEALLTEVCNVHHAGRPDLFRPDSQKYRPEELEILIADETRPIFVACDAEDTVLGYVFCVIIEYSGSNVLVDRKELYIDDLCVDEKKRGLGIGRVLFARARDYAEEIGCYHVTLNVWASNERAMAFYESLGMKLLKKEMEVIL